MCAYSPLMLRHKVKPDSGKTYDKPEALIKLTAEALAKLDQKSKLILETLAKQYDINLDRLKTVIQASGFFKLKKIMIKTGLFGLKRVVYTEVQWASHTMLRKRYEANPQRLIKSALVSKTLIDRIRPIIDDKLASIIVLSDKIKSVSASTYTAPKISRQLLFERYLPELSEKYELESKSYVVPKQYYYKRVQQGAEFKFKDGSMANNIVSWLKCLYTVAPDIIWYHLHNQEFERWLKTHGNVEDIARIVRSVRDKFIHQEVIDVEAVKSTLIEALNRSELADIIHDTVILPLINKLKSDDRTALRRTVDILAEIKDERVVEPLIEKLVSAPTDIRKLIMVALGKIGDKRATTILTKIMLYSSNLDERIVAIRALAQIKDTKALEPLRKVSKDTTVVGKTAREVLEKF
jgi:hypothetical protein